MVLQNPQLIIRFPMKYQFLEHTPFPSSFAARPPLPPELPAEVLGVVAIPLGPHGEYEALSLAGTSQFGIAKLVDITALSSLGYVYGDIYIYDITIVFIGFIRDL